jgi:hypothetical protein
MISGCGMSLVGIASSHIIEVTSVVTVSGMISDRRTHHGADMDLTAWLARAGEAGTTTGKTPVFQMNGMRAEARMAA